MKAIKGFLCIIAAIAIVGIVSACRQVVWDGGFQQVEFRLTFFTQDDQPVEGVRLRVLDSRDNVAYGYPVTDFIETAIPTSNEKGELVFQHVAFHTEFGGTCTHLFFVFPVGTCKGPDYTLQFIHSDTVVAQYSYLEYLGQSPDWNTLSKIKREWKGPRSSPPNLPEKLRIETYSRPAILEFYVISKTLIVKKP